LHKSPNFTKATRGINIEKRNTVVFFSSPSLVRNSAREMCLQLIKYGAGYQDHVNKETSSGEIKATTSLG